jgi:MtfA peptidase
VGPRAAAVDDRVRVLVAAPACRLALNLLGEEYRRLEWVNVVPTTFEMHTDDLWFGFAHGCHSVWLALDALEHGLADPGDGKNVGYHEFAHVLDASDGIFDGVPPLLLAPELRRRWIAVLASELARLRAAVAASIPTVLPQAAAEDEAELFAYATEQFFERPRLLRNAHPDLYGLLEAYYRQDPLRLALVNPAG